MNLYFWQRKDRSIHWFWRTRKASSGEAQLFLRQQLTCQHDNCIVWPFSREQRGYGRIAVGKRKNVRVHTVMCRMAHGEPPPDRPEAAHSCGNTLCVNPNHLRWAKRVENELDKLKTGTHTWGENHHNAKLTCEKAVAIYRDPRPPKKIAADYGCGTRTVYHIKAGERWAHATGHRCPETSVSFHLQQRAA